MTTVAAPERARRAQPSRPSAAPQRQPLRVVRPAPRRTGRVSNKGLMVGPALVLIALLIIAGAQTVLAQGQVSLGTLQSQVAAAQTQRLNLELRVAAEEQPSAVAAEARKLGMVVAPTVSDLPPAAQTSTTQKSSKKQSTDKSSGQRSKSNSKSGNR
jgi:hypothetical protein